MDEFTAFAPDKPELDPHPLEFPVIGIGASAGGLGAFEHFLRNIDPDFEAAYILVQHLDPNHESILAELLARYTRLRVNRISDGTRVQPNQIYIIPSASGLAIEDGVLALVDFDAPRGFRRPIDDFFPDARPRSGTERCGDRSVGHRRRRHRRHPAHQGSRWHDDRAGTDRGGL